MENVIKCKKLEATFAIKKGHLGGPYRTEFIIDETVPLKVIV